MRTIDDLKAAIFASGWIDSDGCAAEVDRVASDLIELSTRHLFAQWLVVGQAQLSNGAVLFGKWSEMLICSRVGLDVLVNPFSLATTAKIRVQVSLLGDIAFCCSSDSGAQ